MKWFKAGYKIPREYTDSHAGWAEAVGNWWRAMVVKFTSKKKAGSGPRP